MLAHMIERLRRVPSIDAIVIATTTDPSCDPIEDLARAEGVGCYRGSEDDVLDRVLRAARGADADLIVETTGDCPLIDPDVVSSVIAAFQDGEVDYCSNILTRTFPRGMDVQVFPTEVLAQVAALTHDPADREHVSLYIYEHPELFRLRNVESGLPAEVADYRLTVDTAEDFELIRRIFETLKPKEPGFGLHAIVDLLSRRHDLRDLNRGVEQKAHR
jgi:spore coat polysaccharide biosynthesis protein SpsF